ncbi:MAG TPA: HNH endonuclease [Phycisphaerae bacterium]|nr:HNH endonuclease [Phycisphaerae bacterium]HNU43741.1 HNH endonuclease [Phycisphaerae bacterium]
MRIVRGSDPGPVTKYGDYKPHLQPLFRFRCAYCVSHEELMGGYDAMEVDHFRPCGRIEFEHLKKEWTNLYYACRLCNGSKSSHWPSAEEERRGLRFINPCEEDPDSHVRITRHPANGDLCWLRALTPAGQYTIDKIRLNRKQLLDIRRELVRRERDAEEALNRNREQAERLANDVNQRGATLDVVEVLRSLREEQQRILGSIEELRSRYPFPFDVPAA